MAPESLTRAVPSSTERWFDALSSEATNAAVLLQQESVQGRHQSSVYELFSEMLAKDGHLFAALGTRQNALLGLARSVVAGGDSAGDEAARAFCEGVVERIPDFDGLMRALLDGIAMGFAAAELVWGYDGAGRLIPEAWLPHRQEGFSFADDGGLLLLNPPFAARGSVGEELLHGMGVRQPSVVEGTRRAPARKFLTLRFGADARHRHGRGLCQHAYWYYWFKKNAVKFWAVYNERFGAPTAVASVPPGTSQEERDRLLDIMRSLQGEIGIVVPESIRLEFVEPGKSGGASFPEFADWCNDEMSKIVLGGTLTSGEGRRSGSLALGSIHELVRRDYLEADARLLEDVLNSQLLRWITELNFPGARPPRIHLDTRPPEDLAVQAQVDKTLLALGVPIPVRHFHERYGRPVPRPGEEALRYDDANLFGYHIQFGVLTVNEARARLGLGPVPWGGRPTADPRLARVSANPTRAAPPVVRDSHEQEPDESPERPDTRDPRGR